MIMIVLLISVFRIIFIPFALSQSSTDAVFRHICVYIGDLESSTSCFKFSIDDYPANCDVAFYSTYTLDAENTNVFPADEEAIKSLVTAKKPVFIFVEYQASVEPWEEILDPKDQAKYETIMCTLLQWIQTFMVDGIILGITDLYMDSVECLPDKICAFIAKVKETIPTLKFGLVINTPTEYDLLDNNTLFDFTKTNDAIDMYIVNMFTRVDCDNATVNAGGGTIIESSDPSVASMDKLVDVITKSKIDPKKIYASTQIIAYIPSELGYEIATYSKFCIQQGDICKTCIDSYTNLYNEGVYIKQYFQGIAATWLDYDDFDNSCECQKYPATKALFDGFDGAPMESCPKLDVK